MVDLKKLREVQDAIPDLRNEVAKEAATVPDSEVAAELEKFVAQLDELERSIDALRKNTQ